MTEVIEKKTFEDGVVLTNERYLTLLKEYSDKFKNHEELFGSLEYDIKHINEKLTSNKEYVVDFLTDNLLYCMEQIFDYNSDYFIYQKDKIQKKNGKVYKNKLPKFGPKTLLKKILIELNTNESVILFKSIISLFQFFMYHNENNEIVFTEEYIDYIKTEFDENKNFSKMLMVTENITQIFNSRIDDIEITENNIESDKEDEVEENKKKSKKNKKNKKSKDGMNLDFMNGLENTKIVQLAKNISDKININEFPDLTDPTKLLSSLSNPGEEGSGGIQNLFKFVIGEVESAFKNNELNEKELMGEAQNIMGQFSNVAGFDPMSILKGDNGNLNMDQFANIFSNLAKK